MDIIGQMGLDIHTPGMFADQRQHSVELTRQYAWLLTTAEAQKFPKTGGLDPVGGNPMNPAVAYFRLNQRKRCADGKQCVR